MALTSTYSIELPDPGGDADQWGVILNNAFNTFEEYLDGTSTQAGSVITGGNIEAVRAVLSTDVTITDASITATDVATGTFDVTGRVSEGVFTLTGTTPLIDPENGTIQMYNLSAPSSPTINAAAFLNGMSVTLGINIASFALTLPPNISWIGGGIPVLETGVGINWITIWNVGGIYYGIYSGAST